MNRTDNQLNELQDSMEVSEVEESTEMDTSSAYFSRPIPGSSGAAATMLNNFNQVHGGLPLNVSNIFRDEGERGYKQEKNFVYTSYEEHNGVGHDPTNNVDVSLQRLDTAGPLSYSTCIEKSACSYDGVHSLWAMLHLQTVLNSAHYHSFPSLKIEFVVVLDTSASMANANKLPCVCATIDYMLSRFTGQHVKFSLVKFSDNSQELVHRISPSQENFATVRNVLKLLKAEGDTNLWSGLDCAFEILNKRPPEDQSDLTYIFLLTDGLVNVGLSSEDVLLRLRDKKLSPNITIHCVGYGPDHCSRILQAISFASCGGLYFYVENYESVAKIFGECIGGIFSTIASNITIQLKGQDGCRIVQFATKFPVEKVTEAKDFVIHFGTMYGDEQRTLLMKLSLRNMKRPMESHPLVNIAVTYTSSRDNAQHYFSTRLYVRRMMKSKETVESKLPRELSIQLNRFHAAEMIDRAICKSWRGSYREAQAELQNAIKYVQESASASVDYCVDLVRDLEECMDMVKDETSFSTGVHKAHAISSMYFQERSTGRTHQPLSSFMQHITPRSSGYGYITKLQEEESNNAVENFNKVISGYVCFDIS